MRDDPRMNLNRLQQLLLEEEMPELYLSEDEALMQRVDDLIADLAPEEEYVGKYTRKSQGARAAEQTQSHAKLDETAAVLTKTKKQLRREEKQRKKAEKKANVNRSIKGLVALAILEVLGILAILGWWLQ